jgi:hypothetical protein
MGLGGLVESRRSNCGMNEWSGVLVVEAEFWGILNSSPL